MISSRGPPAKPQDFLLETKAPKLPKQDVKAKNICYSTQRSSSGTFYSQIKTSHKMTIL